MLEVGRLRLDPAQRRAWRADRELQLSGKAFALLEAFMRRPGQVLSREQLLDAAWDMAFESRSNIVDVYVRVAPGADRGRRDRDRPRRRVPAADGRSVISRLPIRLRLMLPFALGMAVVLAATGFLIYQRVAATLLSSVDQSLRGQAVEATHHVAQGRAMLDRDAPGGASVGQLVAADGHVLRDHAEGPAARSSRARTSRRPRRRQSLRTRTIPGLDGDWRILAVRAPGGRAAIVVAASLDSRDEALDRLVREFLLGGPLALVVATLAGYLLAAGALRPVEAMRRRAASIGAVDAGGAAAASRAAATSSRASRRR